MVDISTIETPPRPLPSTTTMGQNSPTGNNQQASLSAQYDTEEDENANIDPEILAMLEEANVAYQEGLEEQAACDRAREEQEEVDPLDLEFEQAFATLDEEEPGWDDPTWSDHSDVGSVRSYGFGPPPDGFRNPDDDYESDGSGGSLFREKIPPVGMRPILKPKSRVKVTPAEKAAAAMMPFTVSNPANIPAMSFPSNPAWSGAPIPSTGKQTLSFMGVTTSVPVLSDTANVELVNIKSAAPDHNSVVIHSFSETQDQEMMGMAMQELNTARKELIAADVRNAALEADVRRLEEERKSTDLRVSDLEKRLSEQIESFNRVLLDSAAGAHMAVKKDVAVEKELQICRSALAASQQTCNNMNKENGELRQQVSQLANAASSLDKESNEIRYRVTELSNHIAFVNGELDIRTRERDFTVQKLQEAQFHIDEAVSANNHNLQQIAIMESNIAAKEAETKNLATALTKAESDKQGLKNKAHEAEKQIAAKEAEAKNLVTALTKAEAEKQGLENKAQEAEKQISDLKAREKQEKEAREKEEKDRVPPQDDKPASAHDKAIKDLQQKLDVATEKVTLAARDAEAYEFDYFEIKEQYEAAGARVIQLTDTIAELKVLAQQKDAEISQLTQNATNFTLNLEEVKSAASAERTRHIAEAEKLKKRNAAAERENTYVGGLLTKANQEVASVKGVNTRHRNKISELERALRSETATTARLLEELKKERESSEDALHVARVASRQKSQRSHGFPQAPRESDRYRIPTLAEQLAAWKEDDGSSAKFMEDHRRMLKEKPMTPLKINNKIISAEKPGDSSTESGEKTPTGPQDATAAEVGPHEEIAGDFDDSSVTAVEPSVSSSDTTSELDVSDADSGPVTYYKGDYNTSYPSLSDARRPKRDVKRVEQIVYVDKEVVVDKIIKHTVYQARSPIWVFLFVYADLWTIFAHSYPSFAAFIDQFNPVNTAVVYYSAVAADISAFTGIIVRFTKPVVAKVAKVTKPAVAKFAKVTKPVVAKLTNIDIAGGRVSVIPAKISGLIRIKSSPSKPATGKLTEIDIESQTKEPTEIDIEAQGEYITNVDTEPDTKLGVDLDTHTKVTHKLPQLWPNLITAILQLLAIYLVYQSYFIFGQRHIWLSANEITRSAVAQILGREPGLRFDLLPDLLRPSTWSISERLCFYLIQHTSYSYAIPG
ncbi:hypothetical protein V494_03513 [Pseudogymnoascus sp. VKM F-4513 (FW-928)]|nr:hypothetical protein V494_03513 [Pseudogymnoascus sp. VKM F-4513 (FW-928)]